MTEIIHSIQALYTPWLLTREAQSVQSRKDYERMTLKELDKERVRKIVEVLGHTEISSLVNEGKVTLAMIKPHDPEGRLGNDDIGGYYKVLDVIKDPLDVIFKVTIWFGPEDVEEFYAGGPKKAQVGQPSIRNESMDRWGEHVAYMTSRPTTFLLLFSEDGGAIQEWRRQMGHWDVARRREPNSIRGRFAKDNYTSVVHGSDKPEAVLKEISFLRNRLARFV